MPVSPKYCRKVNELNLTEVVTAFGEKIIDPALIKFSTKAETVAVEISALVKLIPDDRGVEFFKLVASLYSHWHVKYIVSKKWLGLVTKQYALFTPKDQVKE